MASVSAAHPVLAGKGGRSVTPAKRPVSVGGPSGKLKLASVVPSGARTAAHRTHRRAKPARTALHSRASLFGVCAGRVLLGCAS